MPEKGPGEGTRLIADAMLGSLARKLRVFGFDTTYFREGTDSQLEKIAREEGRVILTSDGGLFESATKRGLAAILVQGKGDRARLGSLVMGARRSSVLLSPGPTRCALCNGGLARLDRARVKGRVPANVALRHRSFYLCERCGRYYWKGGQWTRLRRLSRILRVES